MRPTHRTREPGVTLTELLIVIIVAAIIVPAFLMILINAYRDSYYGADRAVLNSRAAQALRLIEQTVRTSREYMVAQPAGYADFYGPHNLGTSGAQAWSYKGDSASSRVLLLDQWATSSNALGVGRTPVYRSDGTYNCTTQKQYQPQLHFLHIFFLRGQTLYRRTLTNTTAPLCPGDAQGQLQSCPPDVTPWSGSAGCQARDEIVATGVVNFSIDYYQDNTPSSLIDVYPSSDPTILMPADYIVVTLSFTAKGSSTPLSFTQRMAKGND